MGSTQSPKHTWLTTTRTFFILTIWTLFAFGCSDAMAADPGKSLWEGLHANPPSVPQDDERFEALIALDAWLSAADSETTEAVVAYYQRAVDHALDLLETDKIAKGVRFFQLYSSSVIVHTPETVFAIDLDQGPNKRLDASPEIEGVSFRMTSEQIARLTNVIDISFHTHEHSDHIDFQLTQALLDAGKTVVVTQSNKDRWAEQPWVKKLTVLKQTVARPHILDSLKVDVLEDHQWGNNEHTSGTPCNAFLITTPDGTAIFTKGDINGGLRLYGWLNVMVKKGRHVDLIFGSPLFWRGVNLLREIDALLSPVWAIGHTWEFEHRSPGKEGGATGTYSGNFRAARRNIRSGSAVILTWGEHLDIKP